MLGNRSRANASTWQSLGRRSELLAGSAIGVALLITLNPQNARALCNATAKLSLNCTGTFATTDTTNTLVNPASADREQRAHEPQDVVVNAAVAGGANISGFGLAITNGLAGGALNMSNLGAVTLTTGKPTVPLEISTTVGVGPAALQLLSNGGNIAYSGNGSVTDGGLGVPAVALTVFNFTAVGPTSGSATFGTSAAPVSANFSGSQAISVQTTNGGASVFLQGGSLQETGSGNVPGIPSLPIGSLPPLTLGFFGLLANTVANGGGTGSVLIDTTGHTAITGTTSGFGIGAITQTGNSTVSTDANIGSPAANLHTGILAANVSGAGPVSVTLNSGGAIFANTYGIQALSAVAPISITQAQGAAISGGAGTGISAASTSGNIAIITNGTVNANQAVSASTSGSILLSNSGVLTGTVSAISAQTAGAFINIANSGNLFASTPSGTSIQTNGGPANLSNSGLISGSLALNGSNNVFNNAAGATWTSSGSSNFGSSSAINNAGTIFASGATTLNFGSSSVIDNAGTFIAAGPTAITGGPAFNNTGVVNLQNGNPLTSSGIINNGGAFIAAGPSTISAPVFNNLSTGLINIQNGSASNQVTLAGNYVGSPGSQLAIGVNPLTGTSDKLIVSGNASGTTSVIATYLSTGPLKSPVPVVQSSPGSTAMFTLADPTNGFFNYKLSQSSGTFALSAAGLSAAGIAQPVINRTAVQTSQLEITQIWDQLRVRRDQIQGSRTSPPLGYAADSALSYQSDSSYQEAALSYQSDNSKQHSATDALAMVVKAPHPVEDLGPKPAVWLQTFYDQAQWTESSGGSNFNRRTGTVGFQAGFDETWRNLLSKADAFVVGLVGGDAQADTTFAATNNQANIFGPGFGAYATYINGGFSVDALVKNDWFRLTESSPSNSVNLNNFNVAGNIQYKFDVLKTSFIEPTGGFVYTDTAYGSGAAALQLQNGNVTRLQAGARFGTDWDWNNIHFTPNLLALVYDNVIVTGTALQNIGVAGVTVPSDEGLIRGEFDLELQADFGHGYSAFALGDVRFGEGLVAETVKIGARKQW